MKKIDDSRFMKLNARDKDDNIVEFKVNVDEVLYIIGNDVYLKGSNAKVMTRLAVGDVELKDFKLLGSYNTVGPIFV